MVYSYEQLNNRKQKGIKLDFDKITKEQLEKLFIDESIPNSIIADLYDVSAEKVKNKRYKWNIKINSAKYLYSKTKKNNKELFDNLNKQSRERLLDKNNIEWLSKALTHYLFRNGPIEDMHSNGQFSQDDMKTLNKFMVNRIAGLLKLIDDGEFLKIDLLFNTFIYRYCGSNWDKVTYDTDEIDYVFNNTILNKK